MITTIAWTLPRPPKSKYKGGTLRPEQLAYLAALIDGEGSIDCGRGPIDKRRRTPAFWISLEFGMVTEEPLATVGAWLGLAPQLYPSSRPNERPRWRLRLSKTIALQVLEECLPYLLLKREQAQLVLAIERVRACSSPSRSLPPGIERRMPARAVQEMDVLRGRLQEAKRR